MPTEITYPGVYVEETQSGGHAIAGVPTSITAFAGYTLAGPVNQPVRVSGIADFERTFGSVDSSSDVSSAIGHFFLNGGADAWVTRVVGSADPARPNPTEIIGWEGDGSGMYALADADLFNILVVPNQSDPAVHAAMIEFVTAQRAFAILDLPDTINTLAAAETWIAQSGGTERSNAAAYFPRIVAADPAEASQSRSLANSGAIAGVYARTDQQRGVWKPPAGTEAYIKGADELDCHLNDQEQDDINAQGLNALCNFVGFGNVVWGARTLAGADSLSSDWKYVPVRRTALFIEESVYRGLRWAVFESNDEPLWAEVRKSVGAFMQGLFRQGAFQGVKANEAFFVQCDAATVTQSDINQGILNVLVGFAPLRPAEFVTIRISLRISV